MYRAFPSHRKELCTVDCVDCCLFFPPRYHHIGVLSSLLFWFKSKSFIPETKKVGRHENIGLG